MGFVPFGIGLLMGLLALTAYACCAAATTTGTEHGVNNKRQPNAAPKPSQRGNIHVCCRLQDAKTLCLVCARRIRWDNYE